MFMLFSYIIYQGHLAVAGTMIMLQILTFRELVNLRSDNKPTIKNEK